MLQRLIPIKEKTAWEAALVNIPHSYTHTHWYNQAMHLASQRDVFLYVAETHQGRIVCPLSPRQKNAADPLDLTTPYGYSGFAYEQYVNQLEHNDQWKNFLKNQGYICGHFALHPQMSISEKIPDLHAGKKTYYLNLISSESDIRKQFSEGHRHKLKQWLQQPLTIITDKSVHHVQAFIKMHTQLLRDKQASQVYHFGEAAWQCLFDNDHVHLISIEMDKKIEAAAVFIHYANSIDYFMAASIPAGRHHATGLIWQGILLGKQHHCQQMHLGSGVRDGDSLDQFKRRFGSEAVTTFSLRQIYDPNTYRQLCERYAANPDDRDGYFPPYWRTS